MFIFSIFDSIPEFERNVIKKITKSCLESARARVNICGRPECLSQEVQMKSITAPKDYRNLNDTQSKIFVNTYYIKEYFILLFTSLEMVLLFLEKY